MKIDKTDESILKILQNDSRTTNQQLSEKIGMSASPCWRRVKRLEDEGGRDVAPDSMGGASPATGADPPAPRNTLREPGPRTDPAVPEGTVSSLPGRFP